MRKFQKQQILGVIQSLHTLHGQIRDRLNGKDYETVQTALADCQEAAIQIGEAIEQTEGSGTEAVSYLEQYCENLYQTSVQMQVISVQKAYKSWESSLIKAQNAISHMEERREVVFLPYKASMWDSLESVWKAADEDPDCDAYVIPIPYYDKNPDGSLKEMHYESDLYPEYVPITNYEEYDFENRKPDMIFIHNPYDEFNYVTSVHPFFYAKNLKQYTQQLVYIPYFVLTEKSPNNEQDVKDTEHFCILPGVFYADKVFVQSEDMRTIYINVLTKEFGEGSRQIWENKIFGTGSPKIDKVQYTRKEDLSIPEDWLRVIRKADGSYKKIIFYNTSINGLLKYGEKMLAKMQDVFRILKENQDDVALLWRPHPLIQSTISSMRPELWEAYERIVRQYWEEGWGIYDDTADLSRAVVLSDAYYGDGSSVVHLFSKSGKKHIIQNANITAEQNGGHISASLCIQVEDGLVFKSRYMPGTYKYDFFTGKTILLNEAEGCVDKSSLAYYTVLPYKHYVIFPPYLASKITIWDYKNNVFQYIDKKISGCYYAACIWNDACYLFTNDLNETTIIKENNGVFTCEFPRKQSMEQGEPIKIVQKGGMACQCDEKVYFPTYVEDEIVEYNLALQTVKILSVKTENMKINTIYFDGTWFWLSGDQMAVYRMSNDFSSVVDRINLPEEHMREWGVAWKSFFSTGLVLGDYIFYAPLYYRAVVRIHRTTLEVNAVYPVEDDRYSWGISAFDKDRVLIDFVKKESPEGSIVIDDAGNVLQRDIFECEEAICLTLNSMEYDKNALMYLMEHLKYTLFVKSTSGEVKENAGSQIYRQSGGA